MGCDINVCGERRDGDRWVEVQLSGDPFGWRSYAMFGFLADVRNYSAIAPISQPRGVPEDASESVREELEDRHSCSWLSISELQQFDYDQVVEDRRVMREVEPGRFNGAVTCDVGDGEKMRLRDFLGEGFFESIQLAMDAGAERIIFGFDC